MSEVKTINGPMREDGLPLFHKDFRKQWNESCKAAGLVSIGKDTAAKLLAIVYVLGGEREAFTHNEKLKADLEYIQDVYGIKGGETPKKELFDFIHCYVVDFFGSSRFDDENQEGQYIPEWATKLMQENYGIKL
jgi:hypothetical protein